MKDIEFTIADIKDLMNTFGKNRIGSLRIEQGSFRLQLDDREAAKAEPHAAHSRHTGEITSAPAVTVAAVPDEKPTVSGNTGGEPESGGRHIVNSPIVGTFYESSSSSKPPYVTVGARVKKGEVLFIIESMKLMNEVVSEYDGVVAEIFAKNGMAVEYGQPILSIE